MGAGNEDLCKASDSKTQEASELVARILREVDTADAHIIALHDAISGEDRERIAVLKVDLDSAWRAAQIAVGQLEKLSGQREVVARARLSQSQASARSVFAELWKLVTDRNDKRNTTADD